MKVFDNGDLKFAKVEGEVEADRGYTGFEVTIRRIPEDANTHYGGIEAIEVTNSLVWLQPGGPREGFEWLLLPTEIAVEVARAILEVAQDTSEVKT